MDESICRSCFHSYVCEQFNEHRNSYNEKCHFFNDHFVPAADVVERKRGEWETVGFGITERTRCSNCKSSEGSFGKPPFCNQCGADMRGK